MNKTLKHSIVFCAIIFAGLFMGGKEALAAPTCSSAGPDGTVTYDNSGTVPVTVYGVTETSTVFLPTWSESGGQDDLIWYGADGGGGTFSVNINLASHPGLGNIVSHAYLLNYSTGTWGVCDGAYYVRQNPPPPPLPTCSGALPDDDVVVGTSGQRYTYALGLSGDVTSVLFYAWSQTGGGDDQIAWPGQNEGGGRWSSEVPNSSHPDTGVIYVHVYMVTASYPGGVYCDSANFVRQAPPPPPAPSVDMLADGSNGPITIAYGASATISWTSANAFACNISGNAGTSGSFSTGAIISNTTYSGQCFGDGTPGSDSVTVNVSPPPELTCTGAFPDQDTVVGTSGQRYTYMTGATGGVTSVLFYAWSAAGGQNDLIAWPGQNEGGGRWSSEIPNASHPDTGEIFVHVYMIAPTYPSGTYCDSANFVRQAEPPPPAPSVDMRADGSNGPITIAYGASATISWTSANAFACNVSGQGGTSGSFSTGALTSNTTYSGQCFGDGDPGSDSVTVNVNPPAQPSCTSATPDGEWTISTTGSRLTSANGVANATIVYFATFTDAQGPASAIWHSGTNQGSGIWNMNIPHASHPGFGNVNVHVYMSNAQYSNVFCDTATFSRRSSGTINVTSRDASGNTMPTSWTITCPLSNPACPTYSSGANQTEGTYESAPASDWTIVPAVIPGYTANVTQGTTQTLPNN